MEPWRVQLFGEIEARRGGERITRFGTRKNAALLALLAWRPGRALPRELAMEALWPGVEPGAGRNRLAVALNALRRLLEPPDVPRGAVLEADRGALALRSVVTDAGVFEAALARARDLTGTLRVGALREALLAYGGELLPGAEEDWVAPERARLARLPERAVLDLAAALPDELAFEVLAGAVGRAPLAVDLVGAALRLASRSGRASSGLALYRDHEQAMLRETGRLPLPALRTLAAELERAGPALARPRPTPRATTLAARLHAGRKHEAPCQSSAGRVLVVVAAGDGLGRVTHGSSWPVLERLERPQRVSRARQTHSSPPVTPPRFRPRPAPRPMPEAPGPSVSAKAAPA